jgi:hypothetical protein
MLASKIRIEDLNTLGLFISILGFLSALPLFFARDFFWERHLAEKLREGFDPKSLNRTKQWDDSYIFIGQIFIFASIVTCVLSFCGN